MQRHKRHGFSPWVGKISWRTRIARWWPLRQQRRGEGTLLPFNGRQNLWLSCCVGLFTLRGLEGVPGLPGAPQDEAGLTRKFETSHVGGATCRTPPIPQSALEKDPRPGSLFKGNPVGRDGWMASLTQWT